MCLLFLSLFWKPEKIKFYLQTTLIHSLLMTNHGKRFAIIQNEFGEGGIFS
jgi:hypothetical protein